jgi:hypothetical protein
MVGKVRTINRDLFVRRCVGCGYDGALLHAGRAERCARCGCDLRLRPARSYAEMEGILGQPLRLDTDAAPRAEHRLIQNWLVFLFLSMFGLMMTAYLAAAAMP